MMFRKIVFFPLYLGKHLRKMLRTHSVSKVLIFGGTRKVLTFSTPSSNHVNILVYISLGSIHNPNPRIL